MRIYVGVYDSGLTRSRLCVYNIVDGIAETGGTRFRALWYRTLGREARRRAIYGEDNPLLSSLDSQRLYRLFEDLLFRSTSFHPSSAPRASPISLFLQAIATIESVIFRNVPAFQRTRRNSSRDFRETETPTRPRGRTKKEEESMQRNRGSKRVNKGERGNGNVLLPVRQRNIVARSRKLAAAWR